MTEPVFTEYNDVALACKECGGMFTCMKGRAAGEQWMPRGECKRLTAIAQRGRRHEMRGPPPDEA